MDLNNSVKTSGTILVTFLLLKKKVNKLIFLNTDKWISSQLDSLFYVILSAVSEEILSEMAPTDSKKKINP